MVVSLKRMEDDPLKETLDNVLPLNGVRCAVHAAGCTDVGCWVGLRAAVGCGAEGGVAGPNGMRSSLC